MMEAFDFRKPGRLPEFVETAIGDWHARIVRSTNERWAPHFGFEFEIEQAGFDFCLGKELAARYEGAGSGYRVSTGPDESHGMMMVPQSVGLNLVSSLVGADPAAETEERALSDIEAAVQRKLIEDFVTSMHDTQPPLAGADISTGEAGIWKDLIIDVPDECELVVAKFALKAPFREGLVEWVTTAASMDAIAMRSSQANASEQGTSADVERLVTELPVDVVVLLGKRTLKMSALADLKPGDVLVLEQPINKPLAATVGGIDKYVGWPGKIGNRHAYQINSIED